MDKKCNNIPELLCKKMTGTITQEEMEVLQQWADQNEANKQAYEQFTDVRFLEKQLNTALEVDTHQPRMEMEERIKASALQNTNNIRPAHTIGRTLFKYAAAIALLLVGGAMAWYAHYTKVTAPEISPDVKLAMQQSRESGKTDAVIEKLSASEMAQLKEGMAVDNGTMLPSEPAVTSDANTEENGHGAAKTKGQPVSITPMTIEQLLSARRVTTRHDKEFWLTLDDGTLVHINYNTRLIYPEQFGRSDRNVVLDGEAYFMVAKDKSRPFVVHTPQGSVKVYGTEFVVNTRAEASPNTATGTQSETTSVILVKGSVGVTPLGGKEMMMKPGEQGMMTNGHCYAEAVDVVPFVAWNIGNFVFEDCSLEKLMGVVSKWYNCEVRFENDRAKSKKFTGELDRYSNIGPILESIEQVTMLLTLHRKTKLLQT